MTLARPCHHPADGIGFELADPDVTAVRLVPAPAAAVYEFLADLRNHWLLEDRFVELRGLDGEDTRCPTGGRVRLKGPLGISREAQTRVVAAVPPAHCTSGGLAGTAEIGHRTGGRVSWRITPHDTSSSIVTLAAVVDHASALDHVLLIAGRWWLRRTFQRALANLDALLAPSATSAR